MQESRLERKVEDPIEAVRSKYGDDVARAYSLLMNDDWFTEDQRTRIANHPAHADKINMGLVQLRGRSCVEVQDLDFLLADPANAYDMSTIVITLLEAPHLYEPKYRALLTHPEVSKKASVINNILGALISACLDTKEYFMAVIKYPTCLEEILTDIKKNKTALPR